MEGVQLCTKSLRRSAERGIGDMRIPFGRHRIGVAEEAANDFKAEAARNKVRCVGVTVVMAYIRESQPLWLPLSRTS